MSDNIIDTTNGKVIEPYTGKNNPFAGIPDNVQVTQQEEAVPPLNSEIIPKHAPMLDDPQPGEPTEGKQRTLKMVKRPINPVSRHDTASTEKPPEMTEFDISSLPKKEVHNEAAEKFEQHLMDDLDKAVEKEKQSITERTQAILEAQKAEAEELYAKGIITKNDETAIDDEIAGYDRDQPVQGNFGESTPEPKKTIVIDSAETGPEPMTKVKMPVENDAPVEEDTDEDVGEPATQQPRVRATVSDETHVPFNVENVDDELGDYSDSSYVVSYRDRPDLMPDNDTNTKFSNEELDADLAKELGEPVEESREDAVKRLGNEVRIRTLPYKNKIDLSSFEVDNSNKVVSIEDHLTLSNLSTADWVLPNAKRVVICSALSGPEMLALNPNRAGQSRVNTLKKIYNIIYKHIVSEKPATYDEWLKTTRFSDLDHYYFALFKATFAGSNFMNYNCDDCGHTFIHDLEFDDYVKYADEETEKQMKALLHSGDTSLAPYDIHRCQIDDNYVVDLRNPSIQDTILDVAGLSEQFIAKYEDLMDVLVYIDNVYKINYATNKLEPVDLKPDPNNHTKTVARRISILNKVLNQISANAYFELRRNMATKFPNVNSIKFVIPACKCEKCGHDIKERSEDIEAQSLLFMRHQLGAFVIL